MWRPCLALVALVLLTDCAKAPSVPVAEPATFRLLTAQALLDAAPGSVWQPIPVADLLVLELDRGAVIVELHRQFAPVHRQQLLALVAEGYFDGLTINRVQDNFVAQWGDAETDPQRRRSWPAQLPTNLAPEFDLAAAALVVDWLPEPDGYADAVGYAQTWPVARYGDRVVLAHCYGTLGVGRDEAPDSGNGAELYVVIGHAPRQLERNITALGRVIDGIEHLATLPRGTQALGFYASAEQRVKILRIRSMSALPLAEQVQYQRFMPTAALLADWIEARRNRRDAWYAQPAGYLDVCNLAFPVRRIERP